MSINQIRKILSELSEEDKAIAIADALYFFMEHPDKIATAMEGIQLKSLSLSKEEANRYQYAIRQAAQAYSQGLISTDPFKEDSEAKEWSQGVDNNGELLTQSKPRITKSAGKLSGEAAMMRINESAGFGSIMCVPLWHTGIWVNIKAPSEASLYELHERVAMDKINIGRVTNGTSFTNLSIYLNSHVINLALNCLYSATYTNIEPRALKNIIRVTDIPQLVWGLATSIWPNGYRLRRPCVSNPLKCNHIDDAHVNLSKLSWVDNRAFTQKQLNHMSLRNKKFNDQELEAYYQEHTVAQTKSVLIKEGVLVKYKVPTIAEYEQVGFKWIMSITKGVDEAFGQDLIGKKRDEYLNIQATLSYLCQYAHWVEKIIFDHETDVEAEISEYPDIVEFLQQLSSNNELANKFIIETEDFIRNSIISAIGIPKYDCPKCKGKSDDESLPKPLEELIQIDPVTTFFILQSMKIKRSLGR